MHAQTQWYEIPSNTTEHLRAIDFPTDDIGYIAGDEGVMLKSTNGGADWSPVNYSGIQVPIGQPQFLDIDFVNETVGFAVVGLFSPGLYKTVDGGLTWSGVVGPEMCFPHCVFPNDETNLVVGGVDCFQGAMVDLLGSSGWTPGMMNFANWNTSEFIKEMDFYGNIGLAAVNGPYVLRTVNGGATWDSIPTGLSDFGVHTSVHFVNATTCYAGYSDNGGGFGILVSYDAGLTWQQDINSATFFYPSFLSVTSASNGDVYSGAKPSVWPNQGLIFEFDGVNWTYMDVAQPINDMYSYGVDVTFGIGDSGLIVVNQPIANLDLNESSIEPGFNLYPNPTSGEITLDVEHGPIGATQLSDINGREVALTFTQHQGQLKADMRHLPNGIYILSWSENGEFRKTRIVKE